jgi:hypothetical protein
MSTSNKLFVPIAAVLLFTMAATANAAIPVAVGGAGPANTTIHVNGSQNSAFSMVDYLHLLFVI